MLDSLETHLVSTGEDKLMLEALLEKLNSRFERISSNEREKECNENALAAGFNVQLKGTYPKCGEYGRKSDSPECPENKGTNETITQRVGIPRVL